MGCLLRLRGRGLLDDVKDEIQFLRFDFHVEVFLSGNLQKGYESRELGKAPVDGKFREQIRGRLGQGALKTRLVWIQLVVRHGMLQNELVVGSRIRRDEDVTRVVHASYARAVIQRQGAQAEGAVHPKHAR